MENLVFGDLTIEARESPGTLELVWTGKSNDRTPGRVLDPWLTGVIGSAAERKLAVAMHFERLEHYNSATITSLIRVIQLGCNKGVRIAIIYDKALKWQKLSFEALRVLGKNDGLLEIRSI